MSFVGEILTMTEKGSVIAVNVKEDDLVTPTPGTAQSLSWGHRCTESVQVCGFRLVRIWFSYPLIVPLQILFLDTCLK